ncbi:hypothetical protein B0H14DRAFT_2589348 [Mycena olivaceomarginata]|nr:hypothetical protein B0H14DRAFT_2589348 [Mycena olivaceomarginata]
MDRGVQTHTRSAGPTSPSQGGVKAFIRLLRKGDGTKKSAFCYATIVVIALESSTVAASTVDSSAFFKPQYSSFISGFLPTLSVTSAPHIEQRYPTEPSIRSFVRCTPSGCQTALPESHLHRGWSSWRSPPCTHNEPLASAINSVTVTPRTVVASPAVALTVATGSSLLSPPSFTYERPMGRIVDESYALKIQQGQHELASSDRFQREAYRKAQVNAVNIRLWLQNGHAGVPLSIHVPTFPWFHPKDCLPILALSDPDPCTTFAYWTKDEWKVSDTPIELRDIKSTVFLRLKNVTECVGGPAPTNPLPTINVHLWLQDEVEAVVLEVTVFGRWFHPKDSETIVSLAHPYTCASYGYWSGDKWIIKDSPIEIVDLSITIYLRLLHVTDCVGGPRPKRRLSNAHTPSPICFRPERPPISPLRLNSPVSQASYEIISLSSDDEGDKDELVPISSIAPPSSQPRFPLHYACDMNAGFEAMDSGSSGTISANFQFAFKATFKSSTYHKHRRVWDAMRTAPEFTLPYHNAPPILSCSDFVRVLKIRFGDPANLCDLLILQSYPILLKVGCWRRNPKKVTRGGFLWKILIKFYPCMLVKRHLWTYIILGQGPATPIDKMLHQFLQQKHIIPPKKALEEETLPEAGNTGENVLGAENTVQEAPVIQSQSRQWDGSVLDFEKQHVKLLWDFLVYDPVCDVKNYDPKVVVINRLGDEFCDITIRRSHVLDFTDTNTIQYNGVLRSDMDKDISDPDLHELEDTLITVSLRTQAVISEAIYKDETLSTTLAFNQDPYAVSWMIPGFKDVEVQGPLATWDPEAYFKWDVSVNGDHWIPAIGQREALRIVLVIHRTTIPESDVTPAEESDPVVKYLLLRHKDNTVLEEIRTANDIAAGKKSKSTGRTPKVWARWVGAIHTISKTESRVPRTCRTEAAGVFIKKKQIGLLVRTKGEWASKCIQAGELLAKNTTHDKLVKYLLRDGKPLGIERFLRMVQEIIEKGNVEDEDDDDDSQA